MFSSKKYVFETSETKALRRIKSFLLSLVSGFVLYTIICFILLLVSKMENQESREYFFKRSPDLIVVFTGDKGRIKYALELAKKYKQSNVLISGVHSKNNVNIILKNLDATNLNPNFLDLDYDAKNTVENVKRTLGFIKNKKGFKDILIVSHDYHILRIKAIFNDKHRNSDEHKFLYTGLNSNLSSLRNIKILYKEVFKFFRTVGFLALADID